MLRRTAQQTLAIVGGLTVAACLVQTTYAYRTALSGTEGGPRSVPVEGSLAGRDWVDRAVADGRAVVAIVPRGPRGPLEVPTRWWDAEFWNKRVSRMYIAPGGRARRPRSRRRHFRSIETRGGSRSRIRGLPTTS